MHMVRRVSAIKDRMDCKHRLLRIRREKSSSRPLIIYAYVLAASLSLSLLMCDDRRYRARDSDRSAHPDQDFCTDKTEQRGDGETSYAWRSIASSGLQLCAAGVCITGDNALRDGEVFEPHRHGH